MRYLLAFFVLHTSLLQGQHTVDFTIPSQVCVGQFVNITNVSDVGTSASWDFCAGQLQGTYASTARTTIIGNMTDMAIVEDNGQWYGFVTSRSNTLLRLNFGTNPNNNYTVTSLGNPGGLLASPEGIDLVKENGEWFGLVTLLSAHEVVRLSWGTSLLSTPTAQSLNIGPFNKLKNPIQIQIAYDGVTYVAAVVNTTSNQVSLLNFGSSIKNNLTNGDIINSSTFPGAVNMQGATVSRQCGQWYIYTIAQNKIYKVNVGTTLFSAITTAQITDISAQVPITIGDFNKIRSVDEGGSTYVYFVSYTGQYVAAIKWVEGASAPVFMNLGNPSVPPNPFSIEILKFNGNYSLYVSGFGGGTNHLSITQNCHVNSRFDATTTPGGISYDQAGTYAISLSVKYPDGTTCSRSKQILVSADKAPVPSMVNGSNICTGSSISFSALSQNEIPITGWNWDFGTGTSMLENPTHNYVSAGSYTVNLVVSNTNGCTNTASKVIRIYDAPVASFAPPPNPLCTNNQLIFTNNTLDNFTGNLTYQWYVNDIPLAVTRDLSHTFTNTESHIIKLKTSIPGCSDEEILLLSALQAGPVIDFSFLGKCTNNEIQFTSNIPNAVVSQLWNFNDGGTSTDTNPKHTYVSPGQFSVSLSALSPNGCNNTKTKTVPVYSQPIVNFTTDAPPFSCSGSETPFTNQTSDPSDGVIATWLWNFGDTNNATSTSKTSKHSYANAGNYNVQLTATTTEGCSGTLQKNITIAQSPIVNISNSLACNTLPVNFTATGSNISSYYWEIGTFYYSVSNPTHTFNAPGNYQAKLTVKSNNNCESVRIKNVSVPMPLVPDFSVVKNCVGHQATFTDITAGIDVVSQRSWDFAGQGTTTGASAAFTYTTTGNKSVKLTVTGQSGCSYSKTKTITVIPAPVADFTVAPESGAVPLNVQFTNKSVGTTQYIWLFGDATNASSTDIQPVYTFNEVGDYVTELTASNNEGCESKFSKKISVVPASPDVDLKTMTLSENPDGTMQVIITVQNKGNTFIKDLPVDINISGAVSLREIIEETIAPFSLYNLVLSYGLNQVNDLKFLCAHALLENDLVPAGNRICTELNTKVFLFTPYPNPAKSELHVDWIAPQEQTIDIFLIDAFGKQILTAAIPSTQGLNQRIYNTSNLQSGIYFLVFKAGAVSKTQRIFISSQN